MKIKLGFDEVYVIVKDSKYFYNECLYNFDSAREALINEGKDNKLSIVSLETAIYTKITIKP